MAAFATRAASVLALAGLVTAGCDSYGVDYKDGGNYFQNKETNDTFTALQKFSGCNNDVAYNMIVDPNGDQSECSQSQMQPAGQDQLVTCGNWTNANMYNGDWSLLVVSNNGNGDPIAFQRDFHISVGTPLATVTVLPTSTVTVTVTPKAAAYTSTTTTTVYPFGKGVSPSFSTPASPAITTPAFDFGQLDQGAKIFPSVFNAEMNSLAKSIIEQASSGANKNQAREARATPMANSAKFKKDIIAGREPSEEAKRAFVKERAAHLAMNKVHKRAPDSTISTVYSGTYTKTTTTTTTLPPSYTTTVYTTKTVVGFPGKRRRAAEETYAPSDVVAAIVPTGL